MESSSGGHAALMPPDEDPLVHWARMERLLREVLSHVSVHPAARQWIGEYLDHDELGLAYDTIGQTEAGRLRATTCNRKSASKGPRCRTRPATCRSHSTVS